jgi:uncharacterized membrane protein
MYKKTLILVVFGLAALVTVWDLLQIDAFDNAMLQFATAGVVPGTGVVLTPNQVYVVLGVVLLLAICLIFHKELVRDIRRVCAAFRRPSPVMPAEASAPAPIPVIQAKAPKPIVDIVIPGTPGLLMKSVWYIRPRIAAGSRITWVVTARETRQAAQWAAKTARRYSIIAWRSAVRAWQWAERRIRECDRLVEQRIKRNKTAASLLEAGADIGKQIQAYIMEMRNRVNRAVEK